MGTRLLEALGLVLVIEGLLPFVSPRGYRAAVASLAALDDRRLRLAGLVAMAAGALLVRLV
ncbi:DUF2065 domain-containing protein [Inmirania thermothiophila]|uniref:DUF2065 domain-containing protein n=1 Tax=Inmirania thermothiophila TaxID=1750597 RepID=A0A3N1XZK7_9GAMM|nr:DUF2065 domain-containing protein [Inmirania thermothiophila]ROR32033.1 hypothetical protein EDC57_1219 [Inmirania thermothiophila]